MGSISYHRRARLQTPFECFFFNSKNKNSPPWSYSLFLEGIVNQNRKYCSNPVQHMKGVNCDFLHADLNVLVLPH